MRKILSFLFLLMPFLSEAKSDYPMLHYTIEDGLPSNTIYDIYQDPNGFIWIGTDKGIARYNGQKFETFTTADGLADNECFFFRPDYYGRLWIGTYNGKLCYYKDGIFHNEKNTPFLKLPIKSSGTVEINVNRDSTLTIFFKDDPGIFEIDKEKLSYYTSDFLKRAFYIEPPRHLKKHGKDTLEIFYDQEHILVNKQMTPLKHIAYDKGFRFIKYRPDKNKGYIFDFYNKIFDDNFNVLVDKPIYKEMLIHNIHFDGPDHFVGGNKGLLYNDIDTILPNVDINAFIKDTENNYWIGTAKNGLYKLSGAFIQSKKRENTYSSAVNFVLNTKDEFYLGTIDRKMYKLDRNIDQFKCLISIHDNYNSVFIIKNFHYIENDVYYNFSQNNNYMALGIKSHSQPKVQKMERLIPLDHLLGVYDIFVSDWFHYFKCRNAIFYSKNIDFTKRDKRIIKGKIHGNNIDRTNIYGMSMDRKKDIYFSTIQNIYLIKDTNAIEQIQFGSTAFRDFIFRKNYMMGVTHQNELLITEDYKTEHVQFDTIKSGDCVWDKFYTLNDSTLLISTNNYYRILTLHPFAGKPKYSLRLLENPFVPFQPEFLYVDSTDCYFFKNGAMSNFPINFLLQKEILPSIKFLTLKSAIGNLQITKELNLNYFDARNIAVQFTPISFDHKNLVYEYSVSDDASENWITITGEELNLSKLGYGKFRISVRAKTMSGDYGPISSFIVKISRPYWATWWFITTCILLGILIIAYVARLGIRRSLRKKESEVRFLRSEYKALNALMNPHFIFNSLNSVQSLVNNKETARASKYIRIFSDLIRQNMRNIAQDLIPLSKELDLVENYLKIERLRFKDKLSYSFQISEEVETDFIMIPPLLIQPLVENAIKHGIWPKKTNDGSINIMVYEKENVLFIVIEDNGIGLNNPNKSDTLHESYAMSNIHKRTEQLSQMHQTNITVEIKEMMDEDGKVLGVRSSITIKVSDDTNSLSR